MASNQYLIPNTTAKGGLHSITDVTKQYPPGLLIEVPHPDGTGMIEYEYGYNGAGAAMVQNRPCHKTWGAAGTNPNFQDIAAADAFYQTVGIPQSAIPSTYWGWFHTGGPTINRAYFDCIDGNGTITATDGQGLAITDGIIANATLALTDQLDFAVATEARTAATTTHMFLFGKGRIHLSAT